MSVRPNRFRQESDPVDMSGLTSSDDVTSMVAIQNENQMLRTENLYLEGKVELQQETLDALTAELELIVIRVADMAIEREQMLDDNKVLLGLIDQLNAPCDQSTGSTGAVGATGPTGPTGPTGAFYG